MILLVFQSYEGKVGSKEPSTVQMNTSCTGLSSGMQVTIVKQLIRLFVVGLSFMDDFRIEIAVHSEEILSVLTVVRDVACI